VDNPKSGGVTSGVLVLATLAIAASVVYKTFFQQTIPTGEPVPVLLEEWKDALDIGHRIYGSPAAPVTIVELTDLECPACRGFHPILGRLALKYPDVVQVIYIPYPLKYHKFALPAARGAECSAAGGQLTAWLGAVFAGQDSLGLRSFASFASAAGILDSFGIDECANSGTVFRRIEAGLAYGKRVQLQGTPQIIVNGWKYPGVPSEAELDSAVRRIRDGLPPIGR